MKRVNHRANITITIPHTFWNKIRTLFTEYLPWILLAVLTMISTFCFILYLSNGYALSYNDARSHLDIGRRVVEGLKPGLAQLGSVWLPLPHILMLPTIWNDFMWHTGLAGALQSMISFVATGLLISLFLKKLGVGILGRIIGVGVFIANLNILYMQSTAMTELLLLATMTAGVYELMLWHKTEDTRNLILSSFLIMLATLIRYDGWFLLVYAACLVILRMIKKKGFKAAEGMFFFFCTLAGFGIFLWLLWNLLIFKDPLYFIFGPYSAHAQQAQLEQAGVLLTKGNLFLSLKLYFYALVYNTGAFTLFLGMIGAMVLWFDKKLTPAVRIATTALIAPFIFNVLALYFGHSVLFIQGLSGNTWFNIRYGIMMMPSIAIFIGYLIHKSGTLKYVILGLLLFTTIFTFTSQDAVTIDDARVGSSQKNVSEVSDWLKKHTTNQPGFILISAASHDAIIFSSGLPMSKFIHEGTGAYWDNATKAPDRWARWIIMRTNDENDQTFKLVKKSKALNKYNKKGSFPFADIYELKPEYLNQLQTKPVLNKQK
jgi:hypothetical protein